MATSGSKNFSMTRNEIIQEAFSIIGVFTEGQGVQSFDNKRAELALNRLVKHWGTKGLHLWKKEQGYLFLTGGQESYTLSATGTTHATGSYVQTALNGGEPMSETTMVIDSSTGMSVADNVGIELSDGTMHWDTIATVNSATQITLTTGLASAAGDDAVMFAYTTKLDTPLRILDTYFREKGGNEHQISMVTNREYYRLTNKDSTGKTNQVYYDKRRASGEMYVWPTADDVTDVIVFTHEQPIEDFDDAADEADMPQEWFDALVHNLARRLTLHYPIDPVRIQMIHAEAKELEFDLLMWDKESGTVDFQPNMTGAYDE